MNTAKLAAAINTLAVGLGELAEALGAGDAPQAARPVSAPPGATTASASNEWPPSEYEDVPIAADTPGLGRCPFHGTAWTVKAGGVSKAGKSYNSFWKCDGKNPDDSFCARKPTKGWADTHPISA